jgi:UDP-N-acetylmuramoyl-tripeptide--D-alanyl-D-alanine ligase
MGLRTILLTVLACVAFGASPASAVPAPERAGGPRLDAESLDRSLALGRTFLLNAQRADGSFAYEVHAERGTDLGTRFATREMGGLWALACYHRQQPTPETAKAILKAFDFHAGHAKRTPAAELYLCEAVAPEGSTNVMAIYVLALQDFLAADQALDATRRTRLERDLADAVKFLVSLRLPGGRFYAGYRCGDGRGTGTPTPYADGECLLALARAAKAEGNAPLRDVVLESAAVMYGEYVRSALRADPKSEDAKAFYQWGSMSFYELYTAGWPGTQPYAARTVVMARWMIDVNGIADAGGNNGYAFEGLAVAWELARLTNDVKSQRHIAGAMEKVFPRLMSWQIGFSSPGGAVPKSFLANPAPRGGVLGKPADPRLRIDVTQHQMHAAMLIRQFLFPRTPPDAAAAGDGQAVDHPGAGVLR